MPNLPVNIDATYGDDTARPGIKAHQQHHDVLHALNNSGATVAPNANGTDDTAALQALINASVAEQTIRLMPHSTYITTGLTFSGKACRIDLNGSTIKGKAGITGPVLDFTGYASPASMQWKRVVLDNGIVRGDNTAGVAKKGILFPNQAGCVFRDVAVLETGGAPLDISGTQLSDFYTVVLNTPVSAKANDVPYLYGIGPTNGNRFYGLGLRSVLSAADVGVSGAVVLKSDATYAPEQNHFYAPWVEFLHVPTNGCIFNLGGALGIIDSPQFFDTGKEVGATNTCFIRLSAPTAGLSGGNEIRGLVPGKGTAATDVDAGVRVAQSRNRIVGSKGYQGTNVVLEAGVGFTFVFLGGEIASATDPAVVDNSGQTTNLVIDASQGILDVRLGSAFLPATTRFGSSTGPRFLLSGTVLYADYDSWLFRYADGTNAWQVDKNSGGNISHQTLTLQKQLIHKVNAQTLAAAGAVTIAAQLGDIAAVTLGANATSSSITNPATGQVLTIEWIQDATGGRTYAWPTNVRFAGGAAPVASTAANARDSVTFRFDGTNWVEMSRAVGIPG